MSHVITVSTICSTLRFPGSSWLTAKAKNQFAKKMNKMRFIIVNAKILWGLLEPSLFPCQGTRRETVFKGAWALLQHAMALLVTYGRVYLHYHTTEQARTEDSRRIQYQSGATSLLQLVEVVDGAFFV